MKQRMDRTKLADFWIKIKSDDDLPAKGMEVVLWVEKSRTAVMGYLHSNGKEYAVDNSTEFIPKNIVTHWMPKPDRPKK